MTWADALPNLLIGLREGLEAGLVVSILLAAVRKSAPRGVRRPSFPIWIGVLGAVTVAASFAAVLSYSTSVLSSVAQEAIGGSLSVIAVFLVTWMIFWMRRTASELSGEISERVQSAAKVGAGALAVTAFLSVGREGLETTLFLWTAVKASGETVAPLLGAAAGIGLAVLLCWLLYRGAVRMNLGVFFSRTAIALIVIAAGILAYGLGDLQDAGWLSGQNWVAFDVSGSAFAGSWWVSIITGVTELQTRMTFLQVVAWVVYLGVVVTLFVRAGRQAARVADAASAGTAAAAGTLESTEPAPRREPALERWLRAAEKRMWIVITALIAVPALAAIAIIVALPVDTSNQTAISVTQTACAPGWTAGRTGTQTFTVTNRSSKAGEIRLQDAGGGIVAEIETLGPATSAQMTASLNPGTYTVNCLLAGQSPLVSAAVQIAGSSVGTAPAPIKPVTLAELVPPNKAYQAYAANQLDDLASEVTKIRAELTAGDIAGAKTDWLIAQQDWERVGASYDSFGDLGLAVDGLPDGYPRGVDDPQFTGLHRLEYGLWHGQSAAQLDKVAAVLAKNVATVRKNLTSDDLAGDPTQLPLRAHEIIEDALRDHLSGIDNQGADAGYAMTYADTEIDRTVLGYLAPLITSRAPKLVATADAQLTTLQAALRATDVGGKWLPVETAPLATRQRVNAAIGALLETLSAVPDLLELPPTP